MARKHIPRTQLNQKKNKYRRCTAERKAQQQRRERLRILEDTLLNSERAREYLARNKGDPGHLGRYCKPEEDCKLKKRQIEELKEQIRYWDCWIHRIETQEQRPHPEIAREIQGQTKAWIHNQWKKTGHKVVKTKK